MSFRLGHFRNLREKAETQQKIMARRGRYRLPSMFARVAPESHRIWNPTTMSRPSRRVCCLAPCSRGSWRHAAPNYDAPPRTRFLAAAYLPFSHKRQNNFGRKRRNKETLIRFIALFSTSNRAARFSLSLALSLLFVATIRSTGASRAADVIRTLILRDAHANSRGDKCTTVKFAREQKNICARGTNSIFRSDKWRDMFCRTVYVSRAKAIRSTKSSPYLRILTDKKTTVGTISFQNFLFHFIAREKLEKWIKGNFSQKLQIRRKCCPRKM